jgi:hypothetical protein
MFCCMTDPNNGNELQRPIRPLTVRAFEAFVLAAAAAAGGGAPAFLLNWLGAISWLPPT